MRNKLTLIEQIEYQLLDLSFTNYLFMAIWNVLKGASRMIIRFIIEGLHRFGINIFDTLFGFLNWPEKKIRIKIYILKDPAGKTIPSVEDMSASVEFAKRSFKRNFNVKLLPHKKNESFTELLDTIPPPEALRVKCNAGAYGEEFKTAGSFFSSNLAAPIYTITGFVVVDIGGKHGCCIGPVTDYLTLNPDGVKLYTTLAHEIGHSCGLWHVKAKTNFMWLRRDRGDEVTWWQRNLFRASRHITYW